MPPQRRRTSKATESPGVQIEVDGRKHIVRESDLTPHDVRALRKETGFSWAGLARELQRDPDIDLIAALVWLARRLAGDEVSYDSVLDGMSYESKLDISVEDKRSKSPTASDDDSAGDELPEA